ncbi:8-oxo-dGTP pyrophosphatase MutT, NUDIX family [Bartonella apis]|uniref:NUDIX hydrolase n=1 Tax=Bartonella apis TaxID=1686310 RepID=UPI0009602C38|nr:NUDIX hydrolase [Bartonella apis]OLY45416.1 8-oxo-dGTP pyrophosphatase MutT, NUDIX family [Bartonella apis]
MTQSTEIDGTLVAAERKIVVDGNHFLQVGALVYRLQKKSVEFLVITSRGTGRWIIPKGWPMPGRTLSQAALQEAYEEAGVRGIAETASIGSYQYTKTDMPGGENGDFTVDVFAVLYSHQEKKWPERGQRIFEWVSPEEAAHRVGEPQLKKLLLDYRPH